MTGLVLSDVTVRYGGSTAVDSVSLEMPGGVLALLGPSGCGKSTLLRAIAGLEPLAGGRVVFDTVDLSGVPTHRRRFGLMFQDSVLFPHRTVAGNVSYGLSVAGMSRTRQRSRVGELLELVGLAGFEDRAVDTLSGGQAQRVALARALAPRPRLLLLDEPLAALDTGLRGQLLDDLRRIVDATATPTVFVTHDQDEAYTIADSVALMTAGRLLQTGPPAQVWGYPVDEQAARFLGYTSVLDSASVPSLRNPVPEGARLALRPSALLVDGNGPVVATVLSVERGADRSVLQVELSGHRLHALADRRESVAPGEAVRLRIDPTGVAPLPAVEAGADAAAAVPAVEFRRTAAHVAGGILDR